MIAFLRFIGVYNAAIWFGAALSFTLVTAPAVFSPEIKRIFGPAYTGLIAQTVVGSYFGLHYWCGGIALLHQIAEWVYLGKRLHRLTFVLLLTLYCLGLGGGLLLQPRLKELYQVKYSQELFQREVYSPLQKERAAMLFSRWHAVSQAINIVILAGLAYYLWRMTLPANGPRFVPATKFRS